MRPLRVGGVPEHFNLPWHRLLESGALRPAGIDATWRDFAGGSAELAAAINEDQIDLAMLLTEGAVAAIARGADFRIVSVYTSSPLIWGIHVPASSELRTVDQLRGRRYAISRYGSGSHLMACVHARSVNWSVEALDFTPVGNLDGAREAMAAGEVEVFFWEKFMTQPLVDNGEFRRVADYLTPWPSFVVAVRDGLVRDDPQRCAVALRAVYASAFELARRADAASLIATRYDLVEDDARRWLSLTRWAQRIEIDKGMIESVARTLAEVGLISAQQSAREMVATL